MGSRITPHLRPVGGFAAECAAATTHFLAWVLTLPGAALIGAAAYSRRISELRRFFRLYTHRLTARSQCLTNSRHRIVTVKLLTLVRALRHGDRTMKLHSLSRKLLAALLLSGVAATASAQQTINGAGATFPYPIYSKWFDAYAKVDPSVRFNYQSIGSGGGQKQIMAQTVDFGASDGPMSDDNLSKAPGKLLHIPTVAGAVVITYNLEGNPALKLDGETIAGIYLGTIKKWNDPKIAALNSGAKLPDEEIVVVHRSDGSGTTFIFTDYLSKVSADWKSKVGNNTSVSWPAGLGGKGNEGVAGQVKQTPNSIGYVELIYAIQNKMTYADLKNADGQVVKATLDSVTAALATATVPDDFRFSMTNASGKDSYPIAGVTWLLVYQQQQDATKGKKLVEFLKWAEKDGEKMAKDLDYAPLPDKLRERVLQRISEIKY